MKHLARILALILLAALLAGCAVRLPALVTAQPAASAAAAPSPAGGDVLQAHFIDVGQGDGILLRMGDSAWVIDAGPNDAGARVVQYLREQGISRIDTVVGTHPHEDHIGGLDQVIDAFEVAHVMMPKIAHTTKTFEDVVDAIQRKNLRVSAPGVGDTYALGQAQIQVLGPGEGPYADLNDASIVLRVTYGQVSLLLTGDAEKAAEQRVLDTGLPVQSQVLKAGHHGSATSSTGAFLDAVSPQAAVLSLGAGNVYGHPHREVVQALDSRGIQILRTDELGDIVMVTDGAGIRWHTGDGQDVPAPEAGMIRYIGNRNSQVFHRESCASLPAEKNRVWMDTRALAVEQGYRPCPICKP